MTVKKLFLVNINSIILLFIVSAIVGVAISFSNLYLFHLILFFLAIIWIYQLRENKYRLNLDIFSHNHIKALILVFFWYLLSLIWTPNLVLGLKYIFYLFCGITITMSFISFSKNIENLNLIFKTLSFFIIVQISIALAESFTTFRMPISSYSSLATLFGKQPINFSQTGDIFLFSRFSPPTGFHWNTNDLAICMVISLPFFLCSKKNYIKIIGTLAITVIIIMAASRAVFISLMLVYSLYLIFIKKNIGTLSIAWATLLIFFLGIQELRESENPRINEVANSIEALNLYLKGEIDIGGSIKWRRELIDNGLNAFYSSYGLGLGAGGTVANQEIMGPVDGRFTSMHNFWIELLVEGGVFVAIIISFWVSSLIYKLFIISRRSTDYNIKYYSQSLFLSITTFIPAAISASSTIYFFPMWIMFGFAISVIVLSKMQPNY
tara:strand:+ start:51430 stop:52740 length:1311 start_codon:yes stop_codon:yes gene_type:complete